MSISNIPIPNVASSYNIFSIDNVNAISSLFDETIHKLNWTIDLINNNKDKIIDANSYSKVIRPIFELKYGKKNETDDFSIFLFQFAKRNIIYFNEPHPSFDDKYIYQVPAPYNTIYKDTNEKYYDPTAKLIQNNSSFLSNRLYNFIFSKDHLGSGISINMQCIMTDVLDETKYIIIDSLINISRKMPEIYSYDTIPFALSSYLTTVQKAFNYFSKTTYDTTKGTIYEYGTNNEFNILKVVSSPIYPSWNGQYIADSYIPGSNINSPNIIYQINAGLNRDYPSISEGQIVIVSYSSGQIYYTGIIKMIRVVGNSRLCYQVLSININNIFPESVRMTGDVGIRGNLDVLNYNNQSVLVTDNTRKVVSIHDKMGINQKPFEVNGLLDIDNVTHQNVLDLFDKFVTYSVNSYDITHEIIVYEGCSIPRLFEQGNKLFDYTNQCTVFSVPITAVLNKEDVTIIHSDKISVGLSTSMGKSILASEYTFGRLQLIVKEITQMTPEFVNADDSSSIFSFIELVQNLDKRWYIVSMRAIVNTHRHTEEHVNNLVFTMTYMDTNDIMIDDSTGNTLLDIINYSSKEHRFINYVSLLFKNKTFYDSNGNLTMDATGNLLIQKAIQTNAFFYDRLGLLPESYFFAANITDKNDEKFLVHEAVPVWNSKKVRDLWNKDINIGNIVDIIQTQREKLYNYSINSTSVVNYIWDAVQKISFVNIIISDYGTGPQEYLIGSGFNLHSLLHESLIVNGDNTLSGNFSVNDSNNNVIFKVDNVKKTITNSYNVGIGTHDPKSILDVKDTTVTDVQNEMYITYQQKSMINKISKRLCDIGNDINTPFDENTDFKTIINDVVKEQNIVQTVDHYYYIFELNMDTMLADDIVIRSHWLYSHWDGQALGAIQDTSNRVSLQLAKNILQNILNTQMIFHSSASNIYSPWVFGRKLMRCRFLEIGGKMYLLGTGTNIQSYNLRPDTNSNVMSLMTNRIRAAMTLDRLYSDKIMKFTHPINNNESFNQLRFLNKQNKEIHLNSFILTINVHNISDTTIQYIHISDDAELPIDPFIQKIVDLNDDNIINKYKNFWIKYVDTNYADNMYDKASNTIQYEDLYSDFAAGIRCIGVSPDHSVFTLLCVELRIQDVILPTLQIEGDSNITGDLIITNQHTKEKYVFIDPVNKFFGINTRERFINYQDYACTTCDNVYTSKHNVYVKHDSYPVMVCERVRESTPSDPSVSPILNEFGSFSGLTIKRKSNLYNFDEIVTYADKYQQLFSETNPSETVTHMKYGPDIAFEVCDKTNRTVELGQIQLSIESIGDDGFLRCGFGVGINDPTLDEQAWETSRRQIMYVDNDSTLFVKKINLNGGVLSTDSSGDLFWNNKKIVTE